MEMSAQPRNEDEPRDARLSQLYRESGAPEPPVAIDQAILAAARREVHARPRRIGAWLREWRVPVSIAATLVVSASLVMVVVEEGGNRMEEAPPAASLPALKESPPPAASPTDDVAARPSRGVPPDGSATQAKEAASQVAPERDRLAARQAPKTAQEREPAAASAPREAWRARPAPPPPVPVQPFPADTPASRVAPPADSEQRTAPLAAEAPADGEPPARRERSEDAAAALGASRPRSGGLVEEQAAEPAGTRAPSTSTRGPQGFDAAPPRVSPSQEAARAAPAAPLRNGAPAGEAQERRDAPGASAPPPAVKRSPARIQAAPKPASRGAVLARGLLDQPAEKWLERVEQLRREERYDDAEALMVEFRRRFPDHPAAQRAP
jgi:hypothetical protein